jgi:formylglycine-generating enzyme required for sulfatase activity
MSRLFRRLALLLALALLGVSAALPLRSAAGDAKAPQEPKPGEERSFEIARGVKMKFCWVPPGRAQLGSPKAERAAVQKQLADKEEPEWLQSEAEEKRGEYRSKGFWLGKYPVTQGE